MEQFEINYSTKKYVKENTSQRPRHRWYDNIWMDLRETGWEGVDWMHLAYDKEWW